MESSSDDNNSFRKLLTQSNMEFDYEVNSVKFMEEKEDAESQVYFVDKGDSTKNFGKTNKLT